MFFHSNLRFLRKRKKRSQEDVAHALEIKRSTVNNYENGYAQPGLDLLPRFSDYYGISIDTLINVNLEKLSESKMRELELGYDAYIRGSKLRVLATTVDSRNRENIEVVSHKAKAGYTAGYNDPEFIGGLPTFQLPFLSREKKYRMFQVDGDSMLPIPDKSYVVSEYVEDWHDIKDGNAYVLLTRDDGIVFKVVYNQIRRKKNLLLRSLNHLYQPYEIAVSDVLEVWKFINYISPELPEPAISSKDDLAATVSQLQVELHRLKSVVEKG